VGQATRLPLSSGDSPEEATVGFLPRMCFPPGQLVPLGSLGLEGGILLGFRSEMIRARSSADCAFKPGRTLASNCVWESLFAAQRPSLPSSGESPEETPAGESPAPLPHCPLPEVRLLFGAEYPKGIVSRASCKTSAATGRDAITPLNDDAAPSIAVEVLHEPL